MQTGTSVSASWSHTISASDTQTLVIVVALIDWRGDESSGYNLGYAATYGGQAMTPRVPPTTGGTGPASIQYGTRTVAFHLWNPPTGAQTVTVTAGASYNVFCITGNSVAYQGVDTFTDGPFIGGDGTSTASGTPGSMRMIYAQDTAAITTSGWTNRFTPSSSYGGAVNGTTTYIAFGDLAGTGSASAALSPYPGAYSSTAYLLYDLYPPGASNVRPNCRTASSIFPSATGTVTFSHTANLGDNIAAVLLVAHTGSTSGTVASPATVTYGGQAMTLLGNGGTQSYTFIMTTFHYRMSLYGLLNVSPGTATVSVGSFTQGDKALYLMTYNNVGSFGTALGNNAAITVNGSANGVIAWGGTVMGDPATHFCRGVATGGGQNAFTAAGILSDTALASDTVTMSGVGVPLNQAPNEWFA